MTPSRQAVRVLAVLACLATVLGIAWVWRNTPPEMVLGGSIGILYVHVGAAVAGYLAYLLTAVGAVGYLWRRDAKWDRLAVSSAELGLVLTTVMLATGSIWGKVAQGWWWSWGDARLTLTLLLWFIYAGYLLLRQYTTGEARATLSAVVALLALPLMVLNHFATTLFRTQHPEPILVRPGGPAVDSIYLTATWLSLGVYALVFIALLAARLRLERRRADLALKLAEADVG
jgi:heme exporter protein C